MALVLLLPLALVLLLLADACVFVLCEVNFCLLGCSFQGGGGGGHVTETGHAHSTGKTPRRRGGQVADGDRTAAVSVNLP